MTLIRVLVAISLVIFLADLAVAGDVTFSGDARVRYIFRDNYGFGNDDKDRSGHDVWDSRVRVNVHAKAKGGA